MPTQVLRDNVRGLVANGAQLVEVLSAAEYMEGHLVGAINIPLSVMDEETTAHLQKNRPVIVYCYDFQCDLSARAAWRLESLGFTQVFRYMPGKLDWAANGLPMEGKQAAVPHVSDLAKPDVPVCTMEEYIGDVQMRVQTMGWESCVVVNEQRVVLGLLRKDALRSKPDKLVEQVMEYAPRTYRLDADLTRAADYMQKHKLDSVLVTTSDGHLEGLLRQEDVQHALAGVG